MSVPVNLILYILSLQAYMVLEGIKNSTTFFFDQLNIYKCSYERIVMRTMMRGICMKRTNHMMAWISFICVSFVRPSFLFVSVSSTRHLSLMGKEAIAIITFMPRLRFEVIRIKNRWEELQLKHVQCYRSRWSMYVSGLMVWLITSTNSIIIIIGVK